MDYKWTSGSSNKNPDASKKSMEKTPQGSKQTSRDFIQLSSGPTPENPGLYGGMRPSDRASTSGDSGSEYDKMVDMMQKMMNSLDQAHQKVLELTRERDGLRNTNRELTNQLEQAHRKIKELTNQPKQARSGETSSPRTGESSSHPTKSRDQESKEIQEWFEKRLNDARTRYEERERAKHKKSWWN